MMRITANGTTVEFDAGKLMFAEGRAMERITGQKFMDLAEEKFVGNLTSLQALVWVVFKRQQPDLKFSDLDTWNIGGIELDDDEPDEPDADEPAPAEEGEPDPTAAPEPEAAGSA